MASRPAPRTLKVLAKRLITPTMLRVTLGGEGLTGFPEGQHGGYVKLQLAPLPGKTKPTVRTYTIREQRKGELDVDFALHGDGGEASGPATRWAMDAEPGETIEVGGPGPAKPLPLGFDHYLVAGDMTALPAITVNLEALPPDAQGLAVIEVASEDDRQPIAAPPGVAIRWMVNSEPGTQPGLLADTLREGGWPDGRVYAWAACEFSAMQALRAYLREERGLGPDCLYISSYWKSGIDEDSHKLVKREDAEAPAA